MSDRPIDGRLLNGRRRLMGGCVDRSLLPITLSQFSGVASRKLHFKAVKFIRAKDMAHQTCMQRSLNVRIHDRSCQVLSFVKKIRGKRDSEDGDSSSKSYKPFASFTNCDNPIFVNRMRCENLKFFAAFECPLIQRCAMVHFYMHV